MDARGSDRYEEEKSSDDRTTDSGSFMHRLFCVVYYSGRCHQQVYMVLAAGGSGTAVM